MCSKVRKIVSTKRKFPKPGNRFKDFIIATLLAFTAFASSLWIFKETPRGLFTNKIPLAGDGLLTGLYIKVVDQSSYFALLLQNVSSSQFGWPQKLDFTSYPVGNTQEMLGIKMFMDLTGINDPSQIIHIFSILKAAPIAVAVYVLARVLGMNRILSFAVGFAFSLNTFNLVRAEGHFFLALTWSLPLGLAATYFAFKQVYRSEKLSLRKVLAITILGGLSFISGYYYSFFLIIFGSTSLIFLAIFVNLNSSDKTIIERVKNSSKRLLLPTYSLLIFLVGLLLQTLPVIFRHRSISSLTGLADRSPVEAIIYAGTPESLLFDFYSFGLRTLRRPDLVAYLQSRISWEGSQVGALSGVILIFLLAFFLGKGLSKLLNNRIQPPSDRFQLDSSLVFVILILSTTLLFYFVSPINYGVSRILPQIRAWGRLSVAISLLTLLLLGLLISRIKRSELTRLNKYNLTILPMAILLIFIPISEAKQFGINRPPSIALNDVTTSQIKDFQLVLNELKAIHPKNCSIVNLPIYPFPEFDRPDDQNIDYGQLQIPIIDQGYFRWSYAGIKGTENFAIWQFLISEFPPFARANLDEQVDFAQSLGACGVLIDRTYLNESENLNLGVILKERASCTSELSGPRLGASSRFVSINLQETVCQSRPVAGSQSLADNSSAKKIVWRIDQSSELGFNGLYQVFPTTSTINLRLRAERNSNQDEYLMWIRMFSDEQLNNSKYTVSLSNFENGQIESFEFTPNSEGETSIQLPSTLVTGKIEKFSVTLTNSGKSEVSSWGIQIGTRD
jgi:hypothetical protein